MSAKRDTSYLRIPLVIGPIAAVLFILASTGSVSSAQSFPPAQKACVAKNYGHLPVSFEANKGQADKSVKFLSRGSGFRLYLTSKEAALVVCKTVLGEGRANSQEKRSFARQSTACNVMQIQLTGASGKTELRGEEQLLGTANYFIGSDPSKWHTSVPTYAKVRYRGVYPGIDLVYSGNQRQLEFDFVIAPDAEPGRIQLGFAGPGQLHLGPNGGLVVALGNEELAIQKPMVYQIVDGQRRPVAGEFALLGRRSVGFRLGSYDRARELVIDPVLAYSTFLGGSGGDTSNAIAVDSAGNVYVTGQTSSTDYPVTPGAFQTSNKGEANQSTNAFVTKLNSSGTALVYSTYLGGSSGDEGNAIALDVAGNAYVTGETFSTDFPVTQGALQTTNKAATNGDATAFVTKLNPTGTALVYSTYLGGSGNSAYPPYSGDRGKAIAVDAGGNAYVTGQTLSSDFPFTAGAFQTTNKAAANNEANAFVAKLNPAGTALLYSTYLGGSGVVPSGEPGNMDEGNAIAVDTAGDAYIAGQVLSTDFPFTPGAYQTTNHSTVSTIGTNAFVTELNPAGTALLYSTYLGGSNIDTGNAIAIDAAGEAYVAGQATSTDFPVTQEAFQKVNGFGFNTSSGPYATVGPNAFITKFNATGSSLIYSTYLGGSGGVVNLSPTLFQAGGDQASGLAVDSSGNAYITGATASGNFPVTQGAYQAVNNDFVGAVGEAACTDGCLGGYNAFITELNSTGSALVYSTYLGGNGVNPNQSAGVLVLGAGDQANGLALDSSGNVYVTGVAVSSDFPVTPEAFRTTNPSARSTLPGTGSAFVTKLNMSGSGFTITGTTVTVLAGATTGNTSTITVTPAGGFTGSVALTAAVTSSPSGAQNPPTLSFGSTSPVSITGASAVTAVLTVTTTAAGGCTQSSLTRSEVPWQTGDGVALACVLLCGVRATRRNWRTAVGIMALLLFLVGGMLACSDGGGGATCEVITSGTTQGTYTITVTGTSGATTATGTVTLNVQ